MSTDGSQANQPAQAPPAARTPELSREEIVELRKLLLKVQWYRMIAGILGISNLGIVFTAIWFFFGIPGWVDEFAKDQARETTRQIIDTDEQIASTRQHALQRALSTAEQSGMFLQRVKDLDDELTAINKRLTAVNDALRLNEDDPRFAVLQYLGTIELDPEEVKAFLDAGRLQGIDARLSAIEAHPGLKWLRENAVVDARGMLLPALFVNEFYTRTVVSRNSYSAHFWANETGSVKGASGGVVLPPFPGDR